MEKLYLPGDILTVSLTEASYKGNKGIGHLIDGATIIVNHGKRLINKSVEVKVTEVLQTSTQHNVIFARPI
jgi:uncharacterized protein YacL